MSQASSLSLARNGSWRKVYRRPKLVVTFSAEKILWLSELDANQGHQDEPHRGMANPPHSSFALAVPIIEVDQRNKSSQAVAFGPLPALYP